MKKKLQEYDRIKSKKIRYYSEKKGGTERLNSKKLDTIFNAPILPVPKVFDIVESKYDDEFVAFLEDFNSLLKTSRHIYLSFANTISAKLPVFLILYSIYDKYRCKVSIIWSKESNLVNKSIKDTGAFQSFSVRNQAMFDQTQNNIPVISGSNQEYQTFPDALVDAIRDKYYGGKIPDKIESRIAQAVIETLENVGRHAYPDEKLDLNKKWWVICSICLVGHKQEEYMYLAIFDSGQGIPLSFKDSEVFQSRVKENYPKEYSMILHGEETNTKIDAIKRFVRTAKSMIAPLRATIGDSGLIHASMMHDMTRLDDDSHGQGSVSIKDVITTDPDSKLIIFSNKGGYQYNKGAINGNEHFRMELHNELSGTLLQWSIKLNELE